MGVNGNLILSDDSAGAYFGCASIDFSTHSHVKFPSLSKIPGSEEGEHSHIYGPRDLRFFPGMALGSITPDFTYNSEKGAHAITLELDSNLLGLKDVSRPNVYVNGGPYFVQIAPDDCVKTLAWYSGGSDAKKAAIVECSVGLGKAILCGPHVEYDAVELDNDAKSVIASEETRCCLSRIIPALMVSNAARGILMKKLVERLGLSVDTALEEKARFSVSETPIYAIPLTQSAAITSDKLVKAGPTKDTHGSWVARLVDRDHTFQSMEENTLDLVICESPNALLPLTSFDIPKFALKWTELYASLAESQMGSYLLFKKPFGSYLMYADVASSTQTILEK